MSNLSKLDAQDALLAGSAEADEAWQEFLEEWNMPAFIKQIKPLWMRMDPAKKEQLRKANPELYDKVVAMFATN